MTNRFRNLLNEIKYVSEEVTSSDIATVDSYDVKNKNKKKCKKHKKFDCEICTREKE